MSNGFSFCCCCCCWWWWYWRPFELYGSSPSDTKSDSLSSSPGSGPDEDGQDHKALLAPLRVLVFSTSD